MNEDEKVAAKAAYQQAEEALFTEKQRQAQAARNRLIADIAGLDYSTAASLGYPCTAEAVDGD